GARVAAPGGPVREGERPCAHPFDRAAQAPRARPRARYRAAAAAPRRSDGRRGPALDSGARGAGARAARGRPHAPRDRAQHAGRHRGGPTHHRTAPGGGHRRRRTRRSGPQPPGGRGLPRPGIRRVNAEPQLSVEALDVAYGEFQVLWEASLHVGAGEIVALLGPNGAGKSTLVNAISGLLRPKAGSICFEGSRIDGMPAHRRSGIGIAHVLERRRLFPFLTVHDNVLLGAHNARARPHREETLARLEALLPLLKTRRPQLVHTLSGREQQMVAIARGLMARAKLLMIDEPFLGLAPRMVEEIGALVRRIRD